MTTIATIFLGVLLSQTGDLSEASSAAVAAPSESAATMAAAASENGANPPRVAGKQSPPDILAEALTPSVEEKGKSRTLTLAQALNATADRSRQLTVVQKYWRLSEEAAERHFAKERLNALESVHAQSADELAYRAACSAASASLRETELALSSAQHELLTAMQAPADAQLPMPADRPHVGAYRTNFQELFAMRSPPDRARLIDRTLPIRRQAIEDRATAIRAAQDAFAAAVEAYQARSGGIDAVVAASESVEKQRRAFLQSVRRYNFDIAEYALAVIGPGVTPQTLIGYLILPDQADGKRLAPESVPTVLPAGHLEPIASPEQASPQTAPRAVPQRRPRKIETEIPDASQEIAPQKPSGEIPSVPASSAPSTSEPQRDPFQAPQSSQSSADSRTSYKTVVNDDASADVPRELDALPNESSEAASTNTSSQTSNVESEKESPALREVGALYSGLKDAAPAVRAKQLALALHWDRLLPEGGGRAMSLRECVSKTSPGELESAVGAFWLVRERAAEYQTIAQELEFFDALQSAAIDRRAEPAGPTEMLFLYAARTESKADLRDAHAELVESQFELALRTGSVAEGVWPLAASCPHFGGYALSEAPAPRSFGAAWAIRKNTAAIPGFSESVRLHASAVIEADADRAAAFEKYDRRQSSLFVALEKIGRQRERTNEFLSTLTEYNQAIAEYAIDALPPNTSPDRLAAALIVER